MNTQTIPDISCKTCTRWRREDKNCPVPDSEADFSCQRHQNFDAFIKLTEKAVAALQPIFERGYCHGCKTTIWSDEASVTQDNKLYHLTCLITQRAEKAELQVAKLSIVNNTLRQMASRR